MQQIIQRNKVAIVSLLLLLINFYLKSKHLTLQSIAGDEPFSIYYAQLDFLTIIKELSTGNNPPFFEIILHYWTKLFSINPFAVRFLPCLFSCIAVLVIFKFGVKFFSFKVGLLSSLLFSLSNYHIYFSHEVRVYSLFLLLTCVSMYSFFSLIKQPDSRKHSLALILSNILLLYSHYLSFFVLFIQLLSVISLVELRESLLKRYLKGLAVVLISFLPIFWMFFKQFFISVTDGTWISPVSNLGQLHGVIIFLTNSNFTNYLIFLLVIWMLIQQFLDKSIKNTLVKYLLMAGSIFFLFYSISIMGSMPYFWTFTSNIFAMSLYLCFIIGILVFVVYSQQAKLLVKILLIWFLVPLLIMFISSIWIPMFIDRYWIFITPAFYILIGVGIANLEPKKKWLISLLVIAAMGITVNTNMDKGRDVKRLVNSVKELSTERTIVYIYPADFDITFSYYYNRELFADTNNDAGRENLREKLSVKNIFLVNGVDEIDTLSIRKTDRVIYINSCADFSKSSDTISRFISTMIKFNKSIDIPEIFRVYQFDSKITCNKY